jgi:hypothetical protein
MFGLEHAKVECLLRARVAPIFDMFVESNGLMAPELPILDAEPGRNGSPTSSSASEREFLLQRGSA